MLHLLPPPSVISGGAGTDATGLYRTTNPIVGLYMPFNGWSPGVGAPPPSGDRQASYDAQIALLGADLLMGWEGQSQQDVTDANGTGANSAERLLEGSACSAPNNPGTNGNCFSNNNGETGQACFPLLDHTTKDYDYIQANGGYAARARQWIPYATIPVYVSSDSFRFDGVDVTADFPVNRLVQVVNTDDHTDTSNKVQITSSVFSGGNTTVTATGLGIGNHPLKAYTARTDYVDDESTFHTAAYSPSDEMVIVPFFTELGGGNCKLGDGDAMSFGGPQTVDMFSLRMDFKLWPENWHVPNSGSASRKIARVGCAKVRGHNEERWLDVRCLLYSATTWRLFLYVYDTGYGIPGYGAPALEYDIPASMSEDILRVVWNIHNDRVVWSLKNLTTDTLLVDNATVTAASQGYDQFTRESVELSFYDGGAGNGYEPTNGDVITGNTSGATAKILDQQSTVVSGTWTGGDLVGTFWIRTRSGGDFIADETVTIASDGGGPTQTTNGFKVTAEPGPVTSANDVEKFGINLHKSGSSFDDPAHPDIMRLGVSYIICGKAPMGID